MTGCRGQIVEHKIGGVFFSPLLMEPGVVVLGIVRDHHHAATAGEAGLIKLFHKFKEGRTVELLLLPAKPEAPIAKSYGAKIPHAVSRRMMPQHRILGFWWYPHPAPRTVLLKVHFVEGP